MENIKNVFRVKFKKSDALKDLKELSTTMSKEEFVDFSDSAMLDAYRSNRIKAVEYMLSFYDKDKPGMLLRIHLAKMLTSQKDFDHGQKMLIPLIKHFSKDFIDNTLAKFIEQHSYNRKAEIQLREKGINKIILENTLSQDNKTSAKSFKL